MPFIIHLRSFRYMACIHRKFSPFSITSLILKRFSYKPLPCCPTSPQNVFRSSNYVLAPQNGTFWKARSYSDSRRKRSKEDNLVIRSMVSIIQKTDKWDALIKDLCVVSASEITPQVAVRVVKRIKKPELAAKFFNWLEQLEGFTHDSLTYTAIIKVLTRDCNPSHAAVADSLLRKKFHLGLDVSPADYDYVLHQWARVGRSDMGLKLLNEMIAHGFTPASTSCSILLEELFDSKQEDLGWDLFHRMRNGSVDALETKAFNVIMKFLCVKGKLEEALEVFAAMRSHDYIPDLDTYNILIKGCCEKGEAKMVFCLFKQMLDMKVKPDSYTVNLLIKEVCKQGRPEYGNDLFNHMRRVGWLDRKFVYTQLVESLTSYGWWMKALKIFVKMVRRGHHPKAELYNNLIRQLCMGGRLREAHKLKNLMADRGYLSEIEIYNGLIDGLCLTGKMEMVEKLLPELHRRGLNLNSRTHNIILRGYCMIGNVKAALRWVEKTMEEGWEPNAKSCKSITACLSTKGREVEVEALPVNDSGACKLLIDELRKLSDMECAADVLK